MQNKYAKGQLKGLHLLPVRHKTIIFATVLGAIFMSTLDATIVATALPDIVNDLGGFQNYTFVATSYLIGSVIAIPITGRMIDIYGRKGFYIVGIAIFIGGSLLSGLSRTMDELIIFRGIQGIGAGVMIANAFTMIGDLYPPSERGKYQAYVSAIFGLSSVIGPLAGGFITDSIGWEWIFYINIPIGIVIILLFLHFLPFIRPEAERRIDYPGIALTVLTIVPLLLALSWGGDQYPWVSPLIISMLSFAALAGISLYFVDRRGTHAIIPISLFKNSIILISIGATFLLGFAMYGAIIFVPLWFQGVQGESATASGSYLTPMMLGLVLGAFLSGQALTRFGGHYRWQGVIGIIVFAVGMWLLSTLQVTTGYVVSVIYMVIAGFGLGITFPLYTVAIQNVVPLERMGVAISTVPFWRFLGGALGLAILGTIVVNTFSTNFIGLLPDSIKATIPSAALKSLAHNPHGLIGQGQQLRSLLVSLPDPNQAYLQILAALRQSLNSAITDVMFISFIAIVVSLFVHFFIREIPLRRRHEQEPLPYHGLSDKQ